MLYLKRSYIIQYQQGKARSGRKLGKKNFSEIFKSEFSILAIGQNRKLGNKKTRNNISEISEISEVSEFSICHFFIFFLNFFFLFYNFDLSLFHFLSYFFLFFINVFSTSLFYICNYSSTSYFINIIMTISLMK